MPRSSLALAQGVSAHPPPRASPRTLTRRQALPYLPYHYLHPGATRLGVWGLTPGAWGVLPSHFHAPECDPELKGQPFPATAALQVLADPSLPRPASPSSPHPLPSSPSHNIKIRTARRHSTPPPPPHACPRGTAHAYTISPSQNTTTHYLTPQWHKTRSKRPQWWPRRISSTRSVRPVVVAPP